MLDSVLNDIQRIYPASGRHQLFLGLQNIGIKKHNLPAFPTMASPIIPLQMIPLVVLIVALVYLLSIKYRRGLKGVPGPLLAAFSNYDRIITAASGKQFLAHIGYHEKYGALVRVGPNHVSFSDADMIPIVYGITSRFYKVGDIESTASPILADKLLE